MRLVPSASLSAAMAASQALLHIESTSAIAIVDAAYNLESQKHLIESHLAKEECSFVASFNLRGADADTGILSSCSDPEQVCVEDVTSSLGGRCAFIASGSRRLGTTCTTKCTPASACTGLSQDFINNRIGEGSCCGDKACVGMSSDSIVGAKSCVGVKNCYASQQVTIGDNSCNGDTIKGGDGYYGWACAYSKGTIGNGACYEYAACYQKEEYRADYSWNVGANACRGKDSCYDSAGVVISNDSCVGSYACYQIQGNVGVESCIGDQACESTAEGGTVANGSCRASISCRKNAASIGSGSCNANLACEFNQGVIGDGFCNEAEACRNNTNARTSAPTTPAPTKANATPAPSKKPTASPTKKPTTSPTKKPNTPAPTKANATPAPSKKPVTTTSPTKNPTKKPTTKTPTAKPITASPTERPVTISPTLLLSVDLCYPGCGNFQDIYTNNEFESMIMKYTPCNATDCTVTILDSSSLCTDCNSTVPNRRFLQAASQKSAITFEIVSVKVLNEKVVTGNLNGNITQANDDLSQGNITFKVAGPYTEATRAPTAKPSAMSSSKSSKSASSKSNKEGKASKASRKKPKSGKSSHQPGDHAKKTNEKKQKNKEDMKKRNEKKQKLKKEMKSGYH